MRGGGGGKDSAILLEMPKKTRRIRRVQKTRKQRGGQLSISYVGIPVQGQRLTVQQTAKAPKVTIPLGHTLVLYDPDAVQPSYIHWIATTSGSPLPYKGPSPPPGTGVHHYKFALVKGNIEVPVNRAPVDADRLIRTPIATTEFLVNAPLK
jgi:phosphatidylethanolamine-binding protein (PEBP) family uncharacterized protein